MVDPSDRHPLGPPPSSPPVRSRPVPSVDPFALGGAPEPQPPAPRRRAEGLWIGLAALLGAAAAIAAIAWFTIGSDDDASLPVHQSVGADVGAPVLIEGWP